MTRRFVDSHPCCRWKVGEVHRLACLNRRALLGTPLSRCSCRWCFRTVHTPRDIMVGVGSAAARRAKDLLSPFVKGRKRAAACPATNSPGTFHALDQRCTTVQHLSRVELSPPPGTYIVIISTWVEDLVPCSKSCLIATSRNGKDDR
jgi:hypothetical protein